MVRVVPSRQTSMSDGSTPGRSQRRTSSPSLVRASTAGHQVPPDSKRVSRSRSRSKTPRKSDRGMSFAHALGIKLFSIFIAPPFLGFSALVGKHGASDCKGHAAAPRGVDCRTCDFIFAPGGGAVRPRRSRVSTNPWDPGGPQEGSAREEVIYMAIRVRPLQDRVIVRRVGEQEQKSAGDIIIPDTAKEKPQEGKAVAVGPGKKEDGKALSLDVKARDRVLF